MEEKKGKPKRKEKKIIGEIEIKRKKHLKRFMKRNWRSKGKEGKRRRKGRKGGNCKRERK